MGYLHEISQKKILCEKGDEITGFEKKILCEKGDEITRFDGTE
jgi:hypothetical protein